MHTDGHEQKHNPVDSEHPGYELTDINVGGTLVFLAGLLGSVVVIFIFCFVLSKVYYRALEKNDGPANHWHQVQPSDSMTGSQQPLQVMVNNPEIKQKQLAALAETFPMPRLQDDDGNQDTADLHAREDLLLEHTSTVDGQPGVVRIPIERAMELLAQRGLPVAPVVAQSAAMAGDGDMVMQVPLTNGFARTSFEQAARQTREEKVKLADAAGAQ
jgi:hypothetical protein